MQRKNINRGYQGLFVWQDAKTLYQLTCEIVRDFPFDYKKVVANQPKDTDFENWDQLAHKLENGLIKLLKSLQEKKKTGDWEDFFAK